MLRWALIVTLVALNLSIWYAPLESYLVGVLADPAPTSAQAEFFALDGQLDKSLVAYQRRVDILASDASAQFEYAFFCYTHADYLRDSAGWPQDKIATTVRNGFARARELDPDNLELAGECGMYFMDERFFGGTVDKACLLESWQHVIAQIEARGADDSDWEFYEDKLSYALLQRARVEFRFGDISGATRSLAKAKALSPAIRIPEFMRELDTADR